MLPQGTGDDYYDGTAKEEKVIKFRQEAINAIPSDTFIVLNIYIWLETLQKPVGIISGGLSLLLNQQLNHQIHYERLLSNTQIRVDRWDACGTNMETEPQVSLVDRLPNAVGIS